MESPNLPAIRLLRPAWNKGRIVGQKNPLKPKQVWAIRVRLEPAQIHRNLALFNVAFGSELRGCDLVRVKVADVKPSGQIKEPASAAKWMKGPLMIWSEYLWPGRFHERLHISTRQYARIVREWMPNKGDPNLHEDRDFTSPAAAFWPYQDGQHGSCIWASNWKIRLLTRLTGAAIRHQRRCRVFKPFQLNWFQRGSLIIWNNP